MKNLSLKYILAIVAGIVIIFISILFYFSRTTQHISTQRSLPPSNVAELSKIVEHPTLNLLHGSLIILSNNQSGAATPQDAYTGMAYVLVQYQDDISASSTPILAEPSKVKMISTMAFFQQLAGSPRGVLNAQMLKASHLALAYYNRNGWLLVIGINNLNYDQLTYDVQNQSIVLQSHDHQQGKNLYGFLKEYP